MTSYQFDIQALNDIAVDNGDAGGHIYNINALNAWAVRLGGSGGHTFNINALNEIVTRVGGAGGPFTKSIDALNSISVALGGLSNYRFDIDALNVLAEGADLLAPSAPVLDLVAGSDTGSSSIDNITSDTTPDIDITPGGGGSFLVGDFLTGRVNGVALTPYQITGPDVEAGTISATDLGFSAFVEGDSVAIRHSRSGHNSPWTTLNWTLDTTAPTISTSATASVNENTQLAVSLTANETVTWSVTGGADQARFEVSGSTLRWASNGTKDFESPDDANTDNAYVVQVTATDAAGNATNKTITVTVTDIVEISANVWLTPAGNNWLTPAGDVWLNPGA